MTLAFDFHIRIARPVSDVFEAIADPKALSTYFTTGGAVGRLEKGATVTWDFADFPGAFPVKVVDALPNRLLAFQWGSADGGPDTQVEIRFEPLPDGATLVRFSESGWSEETAAGRKASYGNCSGWMHMACCLKVWLEHGLVLRTGSFVPSAMAP